MVGKKKRQRQALAGGHNRCWIWGRHAVFESLQAGRWRPIELLCDEASLNAGSPSPRESAEAAGIAVTAVSPDQLTRLCGARDHQGLVARMPEFPYAEESEILSTIRPDGFVLVLQGIQDPYNFGSILRSADLFGAVAVFVPEWGQADVTPHVARSSAGAVNHLEIVKTESILECTRRLRERGLSLVAATEKGSSAPWEAELSQGVALIIGNEGTGISQEILAVCDLFVRIPQSGHVGSLNAAVAAGILCYEIQRQRLVTADRRVNIRSGC